MSQYLYSDKTSQRLLKVLAAAGRLPDDEVNSLDSKGIAASDFLSEQLVNGVVKEEVLCEVLSKGFSLRRIELKARDIDSKAFALLPPEVVDQNKVIPFQVEERFLKIAVVDPDAMGQANVFKSIAQHNSEFYLITPTNYINLLDDKSMQLSTKPASFSGPETNADFFKIKEVSSESPKASPANNQTAAAVSPAPESVNPKLVLKTKRAFRTKWSIYDPDLVVEFCDQILRHAINDGCSDIHIESFRDTARVRMRMDGALQIMDIYTDYLFKNYQAVTARFKILAGCDISEKRLAQDFLL